MEDAKIVCGERFLSEKMNILHRKCLDLLHIFVNV